MIKKRSDEKKTFTPIHIDDMNLKQLQNQSEHIGINIKKSNSGLGKGTGHKNFKTAKELRTEIR